MHLPWPCLQPAGESYLLCVRRELVFNVGEIVQLDQSDFVAKFVVAEVCK